MNEFTSFGGSTTTPGGYTSSISKLIECGREDLYRLTSDLDIHCDKKEVWIEFCNDIEDILNIREEQIKFFIKTSITFSFIIAFCLYIAISFVTRRMKKLGKAVDKISKGDYKTRVKKLGRDEVGKLSNSFNEMASSVEKNIEEIKTEEQENEQFKESTIPITVDFQELKKKNENITKWKQIMVMLNK